MDNTSAQHRLLLVEDDDDLRKLLSISLRLKGYAVDDAENGKRAIEIMKSREEGPDLVITDLRMPYNGTSLLRQMREDDELTALPVIVITAWNRADLEDTGQAIACLQKPVDLAELVRTIEAALT